MYRYTLWHYLVSVSLLFFGCNTSNDPTKGNDTRQKIEPVNLNELPVQEGAIALTQGQIVDVKNGSILSNHTLLIQEGRIQSIFPDGTKGLPAGTNVFDCEGSYVMPGLIDVHFHLDQLRGLPNLFLKKGITALRDPGAWIEAYGNERRRGLPIPRLYLTGPHLDMFPPAHPKDALIVRDEAEARQQVRNLVARGASAVKIYYRLSLGLIEAVADESRKLGVPTTAHLEISDAADVLRAGVNGIEHVTSFGLALVPPFEAEAYRQKVLADNNARKEGRYEMWSGLDFTLNNERMDAIFKLLNQGGVFFCPTLAVFEVGEDTEDPLRRQGFEKMMEFTRLAYSGGVTLAVGSHSYVPFSSYGSAYQRELELLNACGMSLPDLVRAATWENARFLGAEADIGSLETRKLADLILLRSNPFENVKNMEDVRRVMLNGVWVD
jgi:imidazolonepropionase-like amidohydrolase